MLCRVQTLKLSDLAKTHNRISDLVEANSIPGVDPNRKYQCKLCPYAARDKYNMRLHLERRHQLGQGYWCYQCGEHCKTKADLSTHNIKVHRQISDALF